MPLFWDTLYNLYYFHVFVIFSGYRPLSEEIKVSYESLHQDESIDMHIDYIVKKYEWTQVFGHTVHIYIFSLGPNIW